jgi:cellulose synthase operon protein C
VLAELRKFEDARNAFARAIQARPDYAEAHYNLSFTLSNLGDFEGALRETKRALELDPYYVAQKFELAIDLQHEDPDLSIVPELGGERRADTGVEEFAFDASLLDTLFTELAPAAAGGDAEREQGPPYAMAADYLSKGLYDRAAAEASRALARGAARGEGLTLLGDVFAKQGLSGEALERYREARREGGGAHALLGEASALLTLGRYADAHPVAEELLGMWPTNVDALIVAAAARGELGDTAGALEALGTARDLAPPRPDVLQRIGDIARTLGDADAAIDAYRAALALDQHLAIVRVSLARLLSGAGQEREAERQLAAALDSVPTFAEATLELAALRRRLGAPADAMRLLVDLLRRDPYNFEALLALGEVLHARGLTEDAATAFTRVLRFDPDHAGALYWDGVLLAERHRYRDAVARWERVIDLEPAGEYARQARQALRTAADLAHIFAGRAEAAEPAAGTTRRPTPARRTAAARGAAGGGR